MFKKNHIKYCEKPEALILLFMLCFTGLLNAQADRKFIRQGNREYEKDKFSESEISYRRALDKNKASGDAVFNAGDALYKQKKYEDAGKQFIESHKMIEEKDKRSASMYNLGNSLLMANKLKESIEAYKNSLKLNPENMEAKYNLAYAQDLLKKQEEQQKQQQQQQQQQSSRRTKIIRTRKRIRIRIRISPNRKIRKNRITISRKNNRSNSNSKSSRISSNPFHRKMLKGF